MSGAVFVSVSENRRRNFSFRFLAKIRESPTSSKHAFSSSPRRRGCANPVSDKKNFGYAKALLIAFRDAIPIDDCGTSVLLLPKLNPFEFPIDKTL